MEQLVSPEMNYRNYRTALDAIETAKEKVCCTPFIGRPFK